MPSQPDHDNANIWKSVKLIAIVMAGIVMAANYFPHKDGITPANINPPPSAPDQGPGPSMKDELSRGLDKLHDCWKGFRCAPVEDRRPDYGYDEFPVQGAEALKPDQRPVRTARDQGARTGGAHPPTGAKRPYWDHGDWDYGYDCPRGWKDCY